MASDRKTFYTFLAVMLLAFAMIAVGGVSAVDLTNSVVRGNSPNGSVEPQATATPPSASAVSVPVTTIVTMNATNGRPDGCYILVQATSNEGYTLAVYTSSVSPTVGTPICVSASLSDNTDVALTASQGSGLSISFVVTNATGQKVYSSPSCFTSIPPPSDGITPPIPQGMQCNQFWETQAPVNGSALPSGTYHVVVTGSVPTASDPETFVNIHSEFDVTLSAA